jgi:membrane fusion protein (multidrug efflux system)
MPRRRTVVMLVVVTLVAAGVIGMQRVRASMYEKVAGAQARAPQTVATVVAARTAWTPTFDAVGTLRAVQGADLAPELPGTVARIHFESGADVVAGAPILELTTDADRAQLTALQAAADLASAVLTRDTEQFAIQAVSQATLDADRANARTTAAQVAEQQALIAKKVLRAPFAGRLGLREVDVGQYLAAGTRIVTLQSLDPIYVDFGVPQTALAGLAVGAAVQVTSTADPGRSYTGTIEAIDAVLDPATRNATVRAKLPNPRRTLLPGTFATVTVTRGDPVAYVTVPQTAVTFSPYGSTVYTVERAPQPGADAALIARQRFVHTGPTRGDQIAIVDGLEAGSVVVTAGQMKLRNGAHVAIDDSTLPSDDPNPVVADP